MSAWAKLLAASSLAIGTAWQLISSPKTGSGVIVNTGVTASVADTAALVAISPTGVSIEIPQLQPTASVSISPVQIAIADNPITIGVTTP